MKRFSLTLCSWLAVAVAFAQPRLSSNKETHNFGRIEWKTPVSVQYLITNTGNSPLVLTNVEPSCACSVAQWTQTPIEPGKKGLIEVEFDAQALGHFEKSIAIYSNGTPNLAYLYFTGEVVHGKDIAANELSHQFGQIALERNALEFPDVNKGEQPVMKLGVGNLSEHPYEPVLMHLPSYLTMTAEPKVLQKGEKGVITLKLDTERLSDYGLTQTSVYLSRFAGDKVSEDNEIPLSVVLLPDFTRLSDVEKERAPRLHLSETEVDVSSVLAAKNKVKHDLFLMNTGHSPLHISKLQVFNPAVGVHLKKNILAPGEVTRLRFTVNKAEMNKQRRRLRILMITNDPDSPKVEININAK